MSLTLEQIFEHNTWANLHLLTFCEEQEGEKLDSGLEGTYGSVRATLLHILGAEGRYVLALSGDEIPSAISERNGFPGWEAMKVSAKATGEALRNLARRTDLPTISRDYGDDSYRIEPWVVLLQVINHGTEHRAQIATVLTQQGISPPEMDGWTYGEASGGMQKV